MHKMKIPQILTLIQINPITLFKLSDFICDSEAIRTLDPRLRRALLYPAELRNQPYFRMQR